MRAPTKADGYEVSAEHLMSTPVVAVTTGHSLAAAWAAMRQRHVHHLVVFDESRLAGVLDDRAVAARWPAGGPEVAYSIKVGDVVSRVAWSVLPDEPASAVAEVMTETHCDAVPVVTAAGDLLGLITATDLVAAVARGPVPAPSPRRHGMALVTRRVRTKDLGPRVWAPWSAAPGDRVGS